MSDPRTSPRRNSRRRKLPALSVDGEELGRMLGVSERSIDTYHAAALIPAPFRLSGRVLWNVAEIRRWLDAGSPDRATWERMKAGGKRT